MIYITGDCHADFRRFEKRRFREQEGMTKDDYVLICGDFGGVWYGDDGERKRLQELSNRSFTTLFVDGNHENFVQIPGSGFSRRKSAPDHAAHLSPHARGSF